MKKTRSLLALALALVLAFSLCSGVFAVDFPQNTFSDVQRSDWFAKAVDCMQTTELMKGVGNNRFDPQGKVTRAMVVTVLSRIYVREVGTLPDLSGKTNPFKDVSNDSANWYRLPVIWAVDAGITKGMTADTFAPDTPITREQMATMLVRFMLAISEETSDIMDQIDATDPDGTAVLAMLKDGFSDAESISGYARLYVAICKMGGVMKGDAKGTFRPQATLTRAECAQTFLNFLYPENA